MTNILVKAIQAEYFYNEDYLAGRGAYSAPIGYPNPEYFLNLLVMKFQSLFFVSIFFFASMSVAQANNLPITVTANESITVTLFFPSEIQKVIQPAVNYKFEYEPRSTMGTLIARKGAASNLTVITKDGSIFSFLLQYRQQVANFTYVLSAEQAIGTMETVEKLSSVTTTFKNENDSISDKEFVGFAKNEEIHNLALSEKDRNVQLTVEEEVAAGTRRADSKVLESPYIAQTATTEASGSDKKGSSLYDTDRKSYYDIYCENNYDREVRISKALKAGTGVELQLNAVTADKNEFYFIFQVTNRLSSRFKAEELRFYVRTSRGDEPVHMSPLHVFNHQEYIEAGRTKKMVYVLKEFRLSKDQKIFVVLDEREGSRNTILKIDSRTINAVGEKLVSSTR